MDSGGFLLSPPASSVVSSTTSSTVPRPRSSPLRSGGTKESAFVRYVDSRIMHIQRRFAKRTSPELPGAADSDRARADSWGDVKGYSSMRDACKDIGELVEVVWVSGTPSLQVAYLITLALLVSQVVAAMPPSPRELFRLLGKLDYAFASLALGRDVETRETLPGFEGRGGVSGTEKVRIRSLVERTRVSVVEAFKRGEFEEEVADEESVGDRMDVDGEGLVLEGDDFEDAEEVEDSWDMQLARVYDRTMVELGDSLGAPGIGLITEKRG